MYTIIVKCIREFSQKFEVIQGTYMKSSQKFEVIQGTYMKS